MIFQTTAEYFGINKLNWIKFTENNEICTKRSNCYIGELIIIMLIYCAIPLKKVSVIVNSDA